MILTLRNVAAASLALGLSALVSHAAPASPGMTEGTPALKSAGSLTFGPDGVLFVADSKAAAIFAIATGDNRAATSAAPIKAEAIDQKIAALLGTSADQILINDLAVNPLSRTPYLSVSRGRGPDATPVIIRIKAGGTPELFSLEKVSFSKAQLPNPPADRQPAAGKKGSNPRLESITDIEYLDGKVIVAGLSNEEFSSTLRAVPFPFQNVNGGTTVEIYHGSHGQFETRAPVRTFVARQVGGQSQILAAYTCTPLVEFSLNDLKPDAKVMGKTIAELGNRNRPIDMIVYQKDGKDFLLLANSSRGVMKIGTENFAKAERIESRVADKKHDGISVEEISDWKGIEQLDKLDSKQALVLRKTDTGALNLESLALP